MPEYQYSPTQRRMLELLADGMAHSPEELRKCLYDDLGATRNIAAHLTALRKALRVQGQDVRCEMTVLGTSYRLVRLVAPSSAG